MQQSITIKDFTELCKQVFTRHDFTEEESEACTNEIVEAQCRGINSHGAAIVTLYLDFKKEAETASIDVTKETPISAFLESNNNAGPAVARRGMDIAIDKAKQYGVGIVGANNRSPFILAGHAPRRAAENGLLGINFSVGGAIHFPPFAGIDLLIASNPLGIALPARQGPIVLDMAFSSLGAGSGGPGLRRYMEQGLAVPEGDFLSKEGLPTTDPKEVLEGGIVQLFGGHKGAGLALMLDLIGRPFVGGKIDNADPRIRSMTFVAIRPDLFVDMDDFLNDVDELVSNVRSSRPRPGFSKVSLPGESSNALLAKTQAKGKISIVNETIDDKAGIGIERKVYDELVTLASG